jgi:thiamine-monophosphate kinase
MKEFELIRQIRQEISVSSSNGFGEGVVLGIGDDAAVLEVPAGHHLVAATDTLNAGTHFPEDTLPFDIAYKCLAVNLSDLAAMGAVPRWALLSLSLPGADMDWIQSFMTGFNSLARTHGVTLVGGDTTSGPFSVSLTALGFVKPGRQLMRSSAKPGDLIVVSGTVGGAARVLDLIQAGRDVSSQHLLDRPQPRVQLGQTLVGYANACIDISDGLLADLGHVLRASACGASLQVAKLPGDVVLEGLDDELKWRYQLTGGDDYELLFTLPRNHKSMLASWRETLDINLTVIGGIEAEEKIHCRLPGGGTYQPERVGFEHFQPGR